MPQFILAHGDAKSEGAFNSLPAFVRGYIECAFFTNQSPLCGDEWKAADAEGDSDGSIPGEYSTSDIAPESLASIVAECADFESKAAALLEEAYTRNYDAVQAGRDFWFTRCGHGVGFQDREELEPQGAEYEAATAAIIAARDDYKAWGEAVSARNKLRDDGLAERLATLAQSFGESIVYLGDDDKIYFD